MIEESNIPESDDTDIDDLPSKEDGVQLPYKPDWLGEDPLEKGGFVFKTRKFDVRRITGIDDEDSLTGDNVKEAWKSFNRFVVKITTPIAKELVQALKNDISANLRKKIATLISQAYPKLEESYEILRRRYAKGKVDCVSRTTLQPKDLTVSYSLFFFSI